MKVPGFMFTQKCTIKPLLGTSPSGPVYSTQYESNCRYESKMVKHVDDKGEEAICKGKIFLPPSPANSGLSVGSEIDINGVTYQLKDVTQQMGFSMSHVEGLLL